MLVHDVQDLYFFQIFSPFVMSLGHNVDMMPFFFAPAYIEYVQKKKVPPDRRGLGMNLPRVWARSFRGIKGRAYNQSNRLTLTPTLVQKRARV